MGFRGLRPFDRAAGGRRAVPYVLALLLACGLPAAAGGVALAARRATSDQERARAALEAGKVVPLQQILDKVAAEFSGKMIQVELEDEKHRLLYEVKVLTEAGRVVTLRYDARTASLINGDAPEIAAARIR